MPPPLIDLYELPEDDRIAAIGMAVMNDRLPVAFLVEDQDKMQRYIDKLKSRFSGIRIIDFFDGPVPGVITVRVGPPNADNN